MISPATPGLADLDDVSLTGRMLGALLYYAPDRPEVISLLELLSNDNWQEEWPCGAMSEIRAAAALINTGLNTEHRQTLNEAYQRLFIGPEALPAPPWGSVYLDRESVVFGNSTLDLRQWQASLGIAVQQQLREPEDHIGLLLMLAAWLAENQPGQPGILLGEHVLPWSSRFLTLLEERAEHPFYQGIARLTSITLAHWQQRLNVSVITKDLFF
ncbi:Tat proofreading chaperone DmsD [Budviciaceae bacterium BWR-B9]|uniref:Tat proofreading chaperone DmsD n=1 Tax=Limnobaculum allomyrinae TaxID=2791986 RepID=A0ABS1ISS7_9GAMM|nr:MULTISPECIES: Tat proofreading chaperone DmsD [Limnobaculum]MBK5144804.1 Tat proofreading chaperone DmsD [Limnobaculum allomyrinae]MBV7692467.1 Tat proofreading chaperone DmsD [Limnobaculum sp. M2-1]